jgi:hypothetical protein
MSEATTNSDSTKPAESRPWHGADDPMEALFQWTKGEIQKIHDKILSARAADGSLIEPASTGPQDP